MATLFRARIHQSDIHQNIPTPFPTHLLNDNILDELAVEPVDYDDPQTVIQSSVAAVQHSCLITLASILRIPSPVGSLSAVVRALCPHDGHSRDIPLPEPALLVQLHELVDAILPSLDGPDARLAQAIVALLLDLQQLPASLALTPAHPIPSPAINTSASPSAAIASLQRQLSSLQPSTSTSSNSSPTPAENVQTALFWARIDEQLDTVVSLCRTRASSPTTQLSPCRQSESHDSICPSFDDTLPPEYDFEYAYEHPPSYVPNDLPSREKPSAEQYPPEKVLSPTSVSSNSNSLDLETITHAIERLYIVAPQLANQRVELRKEKIVQMENARAGKGKASTLADSVDPELDKLLDLLGKASAREIPDQSVVMDPRRNGREKGAVDIEEQRRKYLEHLVHRTHVGRLHSQDATPSLSRTNSSPLIASDTLRDEQPDQCSPGQLEGRGSRDGKRASYPAPPKSGSTLELPSERSRNRSLSAPHLAWLKPKDRSANATGTKETLSSIAKSISSDSSSVASRSVRSFSGRLRGASKSRPPSATGEDVSNGALDIAYVAEHHETLKHVLLFIAYASPSSSNGVPLAEVLPSTSSGTFGDCLFLRLAGTPSPPLALPVPVIPGSKTVLNRSGHWEVKAGCYQSGASLKESEDVALLPASELASLSPSSYVCSSCSLPLVPTPPARYRDLPSEHWEELIEAWMCHPEGQTLTKAGMHGSNGHGKGMSFGFWPTRDEALVGGSYILFDAEAVAGGNIKSIGRETTVVLPPTNVFSLLEALVGFEENGMRIWLIQRVQDVLGATQEGTSHHRGGIARLARCLCGAILGRQHDQRQEDGSVSRMYRLFKYAIRPISATSQVPKIPMSAFVLNDMLEHVQAHATYRFVLSDDEDERPRLLIWLFKPRLRISYMLPAPALLPKSGTIDAAKVLYKILGPTSATSDFKEILGKYPGFPQAEYLFYPMEVCRKLAVLLKESTASYPEGMRTMTGLDVGWLTMA